MSELSNHVPLPRDAVIDRMMAMVNGNFEADPYRPGFMSRDRADRVINAFKAVLENPLTEKDIPDAMRKSVSIATGLTYYDLRAPALNLFPTVTPLRNSIPRAQRQFPGDAAHWKSVLATTGSGYPFMGWVPEGRRAGSMSYTTQNNSLTYMTMGEEDSLTEEARFAAEGFEDEDALVQLRLLLKMFVKEEAAILGGDNSLTLAAPGVITVGTSGTSTTLVAGTYSVIAVALTQEGYLNSSVSGGVATSMSITGNDGQAFILNGGSSDKSSAVTGAVTTGNLTASVPVVNGAVAYAWYVGAAGAEKLQSITTINSMSLGTAVVTTTQAASAISGDHSCNPNYAYDGLLTWAFKSGNNAYVKALATGTAGTGTTLTSTTAGGIAEIDDMLRSLWDNYRVSITVIYVNSQELKTITAKVLNAGSAPLLRYNVQADEAGMVEYKLTAAGVVSYYFNPYTPDGGVKIPIKVHPNLAPGTILGWAEKLPPWYISNNVPEVAVVQTRQDYYAEIWPKTSRSQFYGVYCQSVLAVYAPFAMGIVTNVASSS